MISSTKQYTIPAKSFFKCISDPFLGKALSFSIQIKVISLHASSYMFCIYIVAFKRKQPFVMYVYACPMKRKMKRKPMKL
jgi:hypothetical protein